MGQLAGGTARPRIRRRLAGAPIVRRSRRGFRNAENFFRYVQWIALPTMAEAKSYAEQRGVALMGDIPFGVSYYSADVFARPDRVRTRLVRRRTA